MTGPASELAISAQNVSKRFRLYKDRPSSLKETVTRLKRARYDEFWALRDISLEIPAGATYGLIGHNGSGKSTLLRLMARIHRPTIGRVETRGRISALLDLGAGFHPELSGRENVYLNGAILGLKRREIAKAFDDIVEFAGLAEFIDSPVKVYSSGMYVRLGFSVAVHVRPQVLIIDEVIAVGDEEFQRRCFDHLNTLKRQGVTIVLVSHSMALLQSMCDRIAWLDHGTLMSEGRPFDVIREYVSRVDDQEAERLGHDDSRDPSGGPGSRRQGTREIEVQSLEVLDARGDPVPMAVTGEPATLRLNYYAKEPVKDPVFGIAIEHDSGAYIAALNTGLANRSTGVVRGQGHIDYRISRFPLMPGKMLLSVGVTDEHNGICYDYLHQWFELHVRGGSSGERSGLIELAGDWEDPVNDGKPGRSDPSTRADRLAG